MFELLQKLNKAVNDNRLEGKVSYIVTDNASNMKRAFKVLKELQQDDDPETNDEGDEGVLDDDTLWQDMDQRRC